MFRGRILTSVVMLAMMCFVFSAMRVVALKIATVDIDVAIAERLGTSLEEVSSMKASYGGRSSSPRELGSVRLNSRDPRSELRVRVRVDPRSDLEQVVLVLRSQSQSTLQAAEEMALVLRSSPQHQFTASERYQSVIAKLGGGEFSATLMIGDNRLETTLSIPVGTVVVEGESQSKLSIGSNLQTETLPEIEHVFRTPDRRPPVIVSSTFTIVIVSLLLPLLIVWLRIGGNPMSSFVSYGSGSLILLIFFGLLSCVILLLGFFWMQLQIGETLTYLMILGVPTAFVGHRALRLVANQREKSSKD